MMEELFQNFFNSAISAILHCFYWLHTENNHADELFCGRRQPGAKREEWLNWNIMIWDEKAMLGCGIEVIY